MSRRYNFPARIHVAGRDQPQTGGGSMTRMCPWHAGEESPGMREALGTYRPEIWVPETESWRGPKVLGFWAELNFQSWEMRDGARLPDSITRIDDTGSCLQVVWLGGELTASFADACDRASEEVSARAGRSTMSLAGPVKRSPIQGRRSDDARPRRHASRHVSCC